ncbi:MAG: proline dehydrogenase [Candidatus Aminicenantes bacterium]|nr:proline dehydrogenase [Candidatus Aminicenantes bacterium]
MRLFNEIVVRSIPLVPKPLVRYFADPYIAGETLDEAVALVKALNRSKMAATMDVLGEAVARADEAVAAADEAIATLKAIEAESLDANLSIKLSQLGLCLDKDLCLENTRKIMRQAGAIKSSVRVDMEDSSLTDDTLDVYRRLRGEFPNVGIVLQSCLKRTESDAVRLMDMGYMNFRLCRGIYAEPDVVAFTRKRDILNNFHRVLEIMLRRKAYVGIATHHDDLVGHALGLVGDLKLKSDEYEFQMLLGVRPSLRSKIVGEGHRMRVYVPYGTQWYRYSVRRFRENPEIAGHVVKALFAKKRGDLSMN